MGSRESFAGVKVPVRIALIGNSLHIRFRLSGLARSASPNVRRNFWLSIVLVNDSKRRLYNPKTAEFRLDPGPWFQVKMKNKQGRGRAA